jgi:hypothetical protein
MHLAAHQCADCGATYVRAHFHHKPGPGTLTLELPMPDAMHLAGELAAVINDHVGWSDQQVA